MRPNQSRGRRRQPFTGGERHLWGPMRALFETGEANRHKLLVWDRSWFWVLYKRPGEGTRPLRAGSPSSGYRRGRHVAEGGVECARAISCHCFRGRTSRDPCVRISTTG